MERVPALCLGGPRFDSCWGLRFFLLLHVHVMLIRSLFILVTNACTKDMNLKEQCHEDFAVLGQLCAKIITLRL